MPAAGAGPNSLVDSTSREEVDELSVTESEKMPSDVFNQGTVGPLTSASSIDSTLLIKENDYPQLQVY